MRSVDSVYIPLRLVYTATRSRLLERRQVLTQKGAHLVLRLNRDESGRESITIVDVDYSHTGMEDEPEGWSSSSAS